MLGGNVAALSARCHRSGARSNHAARGHVGRGGQEVAEEVVGRELDIPDTVQREGFSEAARAAEERRLISAAFCSGVRFLIRSLTCSASFDRSAAVRGLGFKVSPPVERPVVVNLQILLGLGPGCSSTGGRQLGSQSPTASATAKDTRAIFINRSCLSRAAAPSACERSRDAAPNMRLHLVRIQPLLSSRI